LLWARSELVNVRILDMHEGSIQTVYSIVNPDKLAHLGRRLTAPDLVLH
jgi:hypothetical protein